MKSLALVLFACLTTSALCKGADWELCEVDHEVPLFTPEVVTLDPSSPSPGTDLEFKIFGKNDYHAVAGGSFKVEVEMDMFGFYYWKVYEETKDICDRAECPIEVGPVIFTYVRHLPVITPPGSYKITLTGRDKGTDELLLCMKVKFTISYKKGVRQMTVS